MIDSITSQQPKTQRYFQEQIMQNRRRVKVYIRMVSRKSIKIQLPAQIALNQLKQLIWRRFCICEQNQLLYLKGISLNFSADILLENNWIIHVINLAQVKLPLINFQVKSTNANKSQSKSQRYCIEPTITVKRFLQDNILHQHSVTQKQILLIQSGRFLKSNLRFLDQNIQNGTTLNLVHVERMRGAQNICKASQINLNTSKSINTQKYLQRHKNQSTLMPQKSSKININLSSLSLNKECQIHHKNLNSSKNPSSQYQDQMNSGSISPRQSRKKKVTPNRSIQIGQRQCNCKKDEVRIKQPKFISTQDKKKMQMQIRQQNLHKIMLRKQKTQQQVSKNPTVRKINMEPSTQRKTLARVKSFQHFKSGSSTQIKSLKVIVNPQKSTKF